MRRRILCIGLASIVPAFSLAIAQDLSLHDAIQHALHSPAAQAWEAEAGEARGVARQAGLAPNPRLYLQTEDLRPWADTFSFSQNTEDYAYLGQTFELDGKRSKRVFGAAARLHEVEDQNAFRRQQLAGRVAAAYWRTVAQQRVVALLRDDLRAVDAMVDYHRKRVDAGAMKGVDLLRMQIERDRLSLALQAAERDAELAQSILLTQIGERPSASLHLTDAIETTPAIAPVSEDVAVAARYDVLVAEDAVRSAEAEVKLQQAYAVPDLDLLAGYKRNSGDDTAYAALQIPLPLRNRNQGEIERTKAALTAAQATLSATRTRATIEIEAAQKYYEQERNIIQQTLPSMQARARENLSITGEAYRIGGIDLLRYIDAERTSFDVEVTALRNLAEFQQAALQLQLAYGMQP